MFFSDEDYACYRALLAEAAKEARVAVWAWCLMPNHVHLILRPDDEDGLRRALGARASALRRPHSPRQRRTGHFWQGRYGAVAMDEDHLAAAYRYVALNPVRARLVVRAEDWRVVERPRAAGARRRSADRPRSGAPALRALRRPS